MAKHQCYIRLVCPRASCSLPVSVNVLSFSNLAEIRLGLYGARRCYRPQWNIEQGSKKGRIEQNKQNGDTMQHWTLWLVANFGAASFVLSTIRVLSSGLALKWTVSSEGNHHLDY